MAGRSVASTADPAVRGGVALQGTAACPSTDLEPATPPRTADGRFAVTDAGVIKALVVERPRRRLGPCSYCGAYSSGGTCEAHDDLPDLDRGVFRDFCSALKAAT